LASIIKWFRPTLPPIKSWGPEHWFVCLALIFGSLFLLLTPPLKGSDEWSHFLHSYQVSNGRLIGTRNSNGSYGGLLPRSLVATVTPMLSDSVIHYYVKKYSMDETQHLLDMRLHPFDRTEIDFSASSVYSPVPYLPAALAMEPGKLLNLPPILLVYFGRLGGLLGWIALIFYSIRLIPVGKWAMVALALIPVSLFQASMISADGITNALAFLLVALTLRFWLQKTHVTSRQLVVYGGIITLLALAKPTYALLSLIVFVIPNRLLDRLTVAALAKKVALITVGFIIAAAWAWVVKPIANYSISHYPDPSVTVSQDKQLAVIAHNPVGYFWLVGNNAFTATSDTLYQSAVSMLGSYDTPLPLWTAFWVVVIITLTLLSERTALRDRFRILWLKKSLIIGLLLVNIGLIFTALYLTYTPVGWGIIYGLQGRYLIALTPLIIPLALTTAPLISIEPYRLRRFVIGSYGFILLVAVVSIYMRYYIDTSGPLLP
jgi:uncharacterized membrane protein